MYWRALLLGASTAVGGSNSVGALPGRCGKPLLCRGPRRKWLSGRRRPPRLRPKERPARMYGGAFSFWLTPATKQGTNKMKVPLPIKAVPKAPNAVRAPRSLQFIFLWQRFLPEHVGVGTDRFDCAREPQTLTTTLKQQQLRPKPAVDFDDLKAEPSLHDRQLPNNRRADAHSPERQNGKLRESARKRNRFQG